MDTKLFDISALLVDAYPLYIATVYRLSYGYGHLPQWVCQEVKQTGLKWFLAPKRVRGNTRVVDFLNRLHWHFKNIYL